MLFGTYSLNVSFLNVKRHIWIYIQSLKKKKKIWNATKILRFYYSQITGHLLDKQS